MGALAYNVKKLNHPDKTQRAVLLATTFSTLSETIIKKEVELIKQQRPALGKYVWHTSLNFSNAEEPESLTNDRMLEIAFDYMKTMGYDDNQYLIVRHHDADHHHVHLLVNRVKYDGSVVSDSNNYHKSQATLRRLEQQYELVPLQQVRQEQVRQKQIKDVQLRKKQIHKGQVRKEPVQSKQVLNRRDNRITNNESRLVSQRSLTKNEIEKAIRTNRPSDKSILQAMLNVSLQKPNLSLQEFIQDCEKNNISLLFNQATTGKISGITYFINDFKIKGQALGNRFKWGELIKYIDYEQDRDSKAISQANNRTKARYGELTTSGGKAGNEQIATGGRTGFIDSNVGANADERDSERKVYLGDERQSAIDLATGKGVGENGEQSESYFEKALDDHNINNSDYTDDDLQAFPGVDLTDDVDDEAMHGRKRRKQKNGWTYGR
ncbi:MAG: hypothetical protein JWP78_1963 [Mucilaginibacter sp.]|nr:hypothetical protein [Mucilaginibacter sp.]